MKPTSNSIVDIECLNDIETDNLNGSNKENDNLFSVDKLRETLWPLLLSLKCFGLTYDGASQCPSTRLNSVEPGSECSSDVREGSKDTPKMKPKCNTGKYYCMFISVLLSFQVIVSSKNLLTTDSFLSVMQFSIPFGWMLLCALQQITFFRANDTKQGCMLSKLGQFIKEMGLVKADDVSDSKRRIKVIVLVSWVAVLVNVVTVFVGIFQREKSLGANEIRESMVGKWSKEHINTITYLYLPIHVVLSGVWIFSTANYVSLCVLVAKRFDDAFQRASSAIKKKNSNFASLRREHVQLCHVVSALDDILSPSALVSYAVYIPLTCILLNVCIITYNESSSTKLVAYIFWISATASILLIISVSGALVNHKVYGLSEVIYDINVNDLDRKSETELMLLISNLNSNSAVLTVGGLTTITKGMILTVFGTVIGYFTILIQFK